MPLPTIPSGNVTSGLATGFNVANSCRFNDGDTAYMSGSFGTPTNAKKWTFSVWIKAGDLGVADPNQSRTLLGAGSDGNNYCELQLLQSDRHMSHTDYTGGSLTTSHRGSAMYRDPSAWSHHIFAYDSTQGVEANRFKYYVNGSQITSFEATNYPSSDAEIQINKSGVTFNLGRSTPGANYYWDGYMAEVVFVDGTQYAASDFGEYDEDSPTIWKPKDVSTLTFGNNGFYLDFEDSSNLGNNAGSGLADLTETNIDATDQATDTPTNNFCTLNPLFKSGAFTSSTGAVVLTQGNCHLNEATHAVVCGTMAVTRGKWYWEVKLNGNDYPFGVLGTTPGGNSTHSYNDNTAYGIYVESSGGNTITAGSWSGSAIYTGNATYMIAIDVDNNKLWCGKDGSWTGDPAAGSGNSVTLGTHEYAPWFHSAGTAGTNTADVNFGGCSAFTVSSGNADANGYGNMEFAVPSGFYVLCSKNLAEYG